MVGVSKVKAIRSLGVRTDTVYDVAMKNVHNFFANGMLVHNTDSMFIHIDPLMRSYFGDNYDTATDDEKIEFVHKIMDLCSDYVNKNVIHRILELHNTSPTESMAKKYNFRFKPEMTIKTSLNANVKKKYALFVVDVEGKRVNKFAVTGFETVRSSSSSIAKGILGDLLKGIVVDGIGKFEIMSYIDESLDTFNEHLLNGDTGAGIPCGWRASSEAYVKEPTQINGMRLYNILVEPKFKPGERGYYFWLEGVNWNNVKDKKLKAKVLDMTGGTEPRIVVIPEGTRLDTNIFKIDIKRHTEAALTNMLENVTSLYGLNIKNTDNIGWA